jgi:TRAP-type C4-dicarboxylate transport system permease small subunit
MISRALHALRWVERAVAAGLLVILVAIVFGGAVGRYAGHPVIWSDEVAQALFVWVAMLAADLTLQRSGHFSIDIFANLLPPHARFVLDLFVIVLLGALLGLLILNGFRFADMTAGRPMPMLGLPSSFATAALPVGFSLMMVTLIEQAIRRIRHRNEPPPSHTASEVM